MGMHSNDEDEDELTEVGSDELLSNDNLRLPDSASILVRIHAVRAWLTRRQQETTIEIGEAALALQQTMQDEPQQRPRRRELQDHLTRIQQAQQSLAAAQGRLDAYEEAEALLEDCINHTTTGERALVEYYLTLEELMQNLTKTEDAAEAVHSPRYQALADLQHRIEQVGAPNEEE
jgi:chromosome segregation ATPase